MARPLGTSFSGAGAKHVNRTGQPAHDQLHRGLVRGDTGPSRVRTGSEPTTRPSPRSDPRPERPIERRPSTEGQLAGTARTRFSDWSRRYVQALTGLDAVVGLAAVLLALSGLLWDIDLAPTAAIIASAAAGAVLWPLLIAASRGYERRSVGVGSDEMRAVLRAGVCVVVGGAFIAGIAENMVLLTLVVTSVPLATVGSVAMRYAARKYLHRRQRQGESVRNVIIVGTPFAAAHLAALVEREPQCGMTVAGVCVPAADIARARELGLNVLGDLDHVTAVVSEFGCDGVAVTTGDATRNSFLRQLAWSLEGMDVELLVHPGLVEVAGPRMHIRPYVGLPLLHIEQPHFTGWRRIVKRGTDLVLTGVGLVLISPVLLAIALAIKCQDRGPVLFRQTRVGIDGQPFTMYKFRSMVLNAEERLAELKALNEGAGPLFKMTEDPRITRVGRFLRKYSLDELPQLLNVLNGTMSLVGPRPPLQSEVDEYADEAHRRLLVQPGLTGLWQVSGRSLLSWEETVRLDLRYVENWTLTFDLLILWKTVFAVLAQRGAY
ncbi:hypothetical protein GCM10009841_26070 [Microlunatus panaciterrae]|uniref:Exopolysaccharide biosynthesis polyprenyl glycosylphosphotransferase n=1 Tax=Microlunatus panaciterrae TaxID=400768 RepID=A0ABS2RHP2_9ACTN|nr:sugar transferase [Microlunatus panaciterrae]MBM7798510.1 exopolysaccharide biosynthesis polyprenyl glycosylphosphotransferase [Microlunatus panaciterrae]